MVRNFNEFLIAKGIVDANIEKYTEANYQFKLKENWKNTTLFEVSWICNRIKHDSSLPINFEHPDHAIPSKFENLDPDKKMVLSSSEFYEYCDSIYQYCHDLYQIFNQISLKILLMGDGIDAITDQLLDLKIRKGINLLNNRIY